MATVAPGVIGQHNHRVQKQKLLNEDKFLVEDSEVSGGVSESRAESATLCKNHSSNEPKASSGEELQCGLRSCLGHNTSGDTIDEFPLVWDWLRHGMQHLRDYDLVETYSNATPWFPWRHWGMRYCVDSEDDDRVIQPDGWREFTNLSKLDSYDQS
jgi:hypothetical protein